MGTYLFRLFDAASQLHALDEFDAALLLDPANTTAETMRQRVVAQETPGGVSRDLDISPDYKDISAGLLGETQLVLSEFLALQETSTEDEIAAATKDQLQLSVGQLGDRLTEAQLDLVSADDGVQVANSDRSMYDAQWASLQQQIFDLQDQPLSLGDLATTLGGVAAGIAGLVTGVGAIVSIPGALAVADNPPSGLSQVLGFLATGQQFWNNKSVGGDMTDLLKGGQDAITNFGKVYDELSGSTASAAITQLALQQATVAMQEMVAQLRQQQAADQVIAAQTRVSDLTTEVAAAQSLLGTWTETEAFIDAVLGQLLTVARALADMVPEDVFLARRALEIYQLTDASDVHFDYGYLHPDTDYNLAGQPLQRVLASLESLATLPADVITWNQVFAALNEAQTSGYDVVHPMIEVVIDDPVALDQLRSGDGLHFSVGIGPDPVAATIPPGHLRTEGRQLAAGAQRGHGLWLGAGLGTAQRALGDEAPADRRPARSARHRVLAIPARRGVQPGARLRPQRPHSGAAADLHRSWAAVLVLGPGGASGLDAVRRHLLDRSTRPDRAQRSAAFDRMHRPGRARRGNTVGTPGHAGCDGSTSQRPARRCPRRYARPLRTAIPAPDAEIAAPGNGRVAAGAVRHAGQSRAVRERRKQCSGSAVMVVRLCRSGWSGSAAGSARAEDVVGEHGDGAVDEAYVPVAAGVVGELLAG